MDGVPACALTAPFNANIHGAFRLFLLLNPAAIDSDPIVFRKKPASVPISSPVRLEVVSPLQLFIFDFLLALRPCVKT